MPNVAVWPHKFINSYRQQASLDMQGLKYTQRISGFSCEVAIFCLFQLNL